jgi:tight adherence protein C
MPIVQIISDSQAILLGLIFITVVLVVGGVFILLTSRNGAIARLPAGAAGAPVSLRYEAPRSPFAAWLSRVGTGAADSYDPTTRNKVRLQLIRAGYRNPVAIYIYYAARLVLGLTLPFIVTSFGYLVLGNLDTHRLLLVAFGSAAAGLYLPGYWLSKRVASRQTEIRCSFPDALDMLLVCVEAGASFAAALQRVAQDVDRSHPVLGEELGLISAGLSAGQSREDALRQFAERAGTDDVSSFVTIMIQSEAFGTSVADSLRVQASEMRAKRLLRAEEMANKLPVKLTFPMSAMIFPTLLIIILMPVLIRIYDAFEGRL